MSIEIGAPAVLPLGLVRLEAAEDVRLCLLGLTLRHPPVQLTATAGDDLVVTGARADRGSEYASRFLEYHGLDRAATVEIELAIPAFVGLGSEVMVGLSVARALGHVADVPESESDTGALARALDLEPQRVLERCAFDRGGLLLVDTQSSSVASLPIRRRHEIEHDDANAWALVLFLPRVPADTPITAEGDRLIRHLAAADHLPTESGRLVTDVLWPAVDDDDLAVFGEGVRAVQEVNEVALSRAGVSRRIGDDERVALDLMRENGAVVCGQSITGNCVFALVKGAQASIDLRTVLRARLGAFAGIIMATITDNAGVRTVVRERSQGNRI